MIDRNTFRLCVCHSVAGMWDILHSNTRLAWGSGLQNRCSSYLHATLVVM